MNDSTGFPQDRDHAPIDSEIYALLDSIGATYSIRDGIVTVLSKYGDLWNFTEPKHLGNNSSDDDTITPKFVTCDKCGWVHFAVTRAHAEHEVAKFNDWFDRQPQETKDMYGGRGSSIEKDYDRCFLCGPGATFHPSQPGDCPDGCTIQGTIYEGEDDELRSETKE